MKPIIMYIDDEPRNLTVFEASMPESWEVKCFDNATDALKGLKTLNPWVIVSDQRMPGMTGLEFLTLAEQILPDVVRIVVTGQTEESTIIQLIRKAKIFDYITKPWITEDLIAQIEYGVNYYQAIQERKKALAQIEVKNRELENRNQELSRLTAELRTVNQREMELREEVSAWAPLPVVQALREDGLSFPMRRDLIGITYDIVGSSELSGKLLHEIPIKSHVLRMFTENLMKRGGVRESSSGDSVYGHFGVTEKKLSDFSAALAVAQEFRVSLRGFSSVHKVPVECGIALHLIQNAMVQLHEIRAETPSGSVIQKYFDTESPDIDLLHRMEKLVHELPGSNIILSEAAVKGLRDRPQNLVALGSIILKGAARPVNLFLIPSDQISAGQLEQFTTTHFSNQKKKVA